MIDPLAISPGRLLSQGEKCTITPTEADVVVIKKKSGPAFVEVARKQLAAGESWTWTPLECGNYLAEFSTGPKLLQRPIAVVSEGWAVCQITVGSFTSEDFAGTIHPAGISADYYVGLGRADRPSPFSLTDDRWTAYEQKFGDAIFPHVTADFAQIDPALAHRDPNWDSLKPDEIRARLLKLQEWFHKKGFQPLDRLATYTPCNALVAGCEQTGMRILHSLIPEQNWSDGEWAINHWGMPVCPFWISSEDFRKPGSRSATSVIGMTMNHYQVVLPHLTHWGDFVLSPSHFARWNRSADCGDEPVRFRQFLADSVGGWRSLSSHPFFFVAGFEFGRTFGTRLMTTYNRRGLESLIELAQDQPLAFATGRDVLAYYERHIDRFPESVFRQRDSWAGVTVNAKPAWVGDSLVVERNDYKAALIEGESSPFFYYDYTLPWKYETRDENMPDDYAAACRRELKAVWEPTRLLLEAASPLTRCVPLAVWDAEPVGSSFAVIKLPDLEDQRVVHLLEVPRGWSGKCEITLRPATPSRDMRHLDGWKIQTFGTGKNRHTYLILDRPIIDDVTVPIQLLQATRVDGATELLGQRDAGEIPLVFGPLKRWYRFWECDARDIEPPPIDSSSPVTSALLPDDFQPRIEAHAAELRQAALRRMGIAQSDILLEVLCGGNLPLGTRSRAAASDRIFPPHAKLDARESSDGVISYGPGRSFWYHPRGLHTKIRAPGFPPGSRKFSVLLNSFDPVGLDAAYHVHVGDRKLGHWRLPRSPFDEAAWFSFELSDHDFGPDGIAHLGFSTDQVQVLERWWQDRGFIAALHALWIVKA
jgi:hypothetical protein